MTPAPVAMATQVRVASAAPVSVDVSHQCVFVFDTRLCIYFMIFTKLGQDYLEFAGGAEKPEGGREVTSTQSCSRP